jgi:hypothetical protein
MGKYINIAISLREKKITGCFGGEGKAEVNSIKVGALNHVTRERSVRSLRSDEIREKIIGEICKLNVNPEKPAPET